MLLLEMNIPVLTVLDGEMETLSKLPSGSDSLLEGMMGD